MCVKRQRIQKKIRVAMARKVVQGGNARRENEPGRIDAAQLRLLAQVAFGRGIIAQQP